MVFPIDRMLAAVQQTYDRWTAENGWGCCLDMARSIQSVLQKDFHCESMDWDTSPPHTTLWVSDGRRTWNIDVPWWIYEEFHQYLRWVKIYGVTFKETDFVIQFIDTEEGEEFATRANKCLNNRYCVVKHGFSCWVVEEGELEGTEEVLLYGTYKECNRFAKVVQGS